MVRILFSCAYAALCPPPSTHPVYARPSKKKRKFVSTAPPPNVICVVRFSQSTTTSMFSFHQSRRKHVFPLTKAGSSSVKHCEKNTLGEGSGKLVPYTRYTTAYTTPPVTTCWGSEKLTTQCDMLQECDTQRTPVIYRVVILGFDLIHHSGVVYSRGVIHNILGGIHCRTR